MSWADQKRGPNWLVIALIATVIAIGVYVFYQPKKSVPAPEPAATDQPHSS